MDKVRKGTCIICRKENVELSDEHIIPEAIGGEMHSYQVCKECNSNILGQYIDPLLTNNFFTELERFSKRIGGKKGAIPNPLGGTMKGDDMNIYRVEDNNGKLEPHLLPRIKIDDDGQTHKINIVLDARDKNKLQNILDKICVRNGWRQYKINEEELRTEKVVSPSFKSDVKINLQSFKLGMLKIAYEFAVKTIPEYYNDTLAIKISEILYQHSIKRLDELILIGNGIEDALGRYFGKLIDFSKGTKHFLLLINIHKALYCYVKLFNSFSLIIKMSDTEYTCIGIGHVAINDIEIHQVEELSIVELVSKYTNFSS